MSKPTLEIYWPQEPDVTLETFYPTGEIGSRRKGRRKGCRNKTPNERALMKEHIRRVKNEKERERVKNIQYQYNRLRIALGDDIQKKLCKQKVLDSAIQYITKLIGLLSESEEDDDISTKLECNEQIDEKSTSSSGSNSPLSPLFATDYEFPSQSLTIFESPPPPPVITFGSPENYYHIFTSPPSFNDSFHSPYHLHHLDL
jgi:hypothetical protein